MKYILVFFSLSFASLFAGSVRIVNDSPFPLHAEVISSDGTRKGKILVGPQEQVIWQDSFSGASVWSQTPYTIIFTCKDGNQFGVLSGFQQGATVTALSSSGQRYCQPLKKKETQHNLKNGKEPSFPFENNPAGSTNPADPSDSPGDPIWGPP